MARFFSLKVLNAKGFVKRWLLLFGCTTLFLFLIYRHNPKRTRYKFEQERLKFADNVHSNRSVVHLKTYFRTRLHPPGLILQTKGGIGNQLFQYACSYALAKDLDWPLYLYFENFQLSPRIFQPDSREIALDKFQINLNIIDKTTRLSANISYLDDLTLFQRKFLYTPNLQNKFLESTADCQSMEYWKNYQNEIKAMFQPKMSAINFPKLEKVINKIRNSEESVAVHVRRGDFVGRKSFFIPISYQRSAMRKMISILKGRGKTKPVFFIFSDDIAHAENKLKDFGDTYELVFVPREITNSTSIEDFYLMTLCKHIIIPNSTYSWWAAYLIKYKEKIVIASVHNPNFFRDFPGKDDLFDELFGRLYHPKEWLVIDPFTGGLSKEGGK